MKAHARHNAIQDIEHRIGEGIRKATEADPEVTTSEILAALSSTLSRYHWREVNWEREEAQ